MTPLAKAGHRLVRRVAREDSPASAELFALAAGAQKSWTLETWARVLRDLDSCNDRVADWLALRE